jgi:hypothetical protein
MDGLLNIQMAVEKSQKTVDLKYRLSYNKDVGRDTTMSPYKCVVIH